MSDDGVYGEDMKRRRLSDHEVELLLSGRSPEEEDLARLVAFLDAMKREHLRVPEEEAIATFAAEAALIATTTPAESAAPPSRRRTSGLLSSRRFVSTAAGFAIVLGMTGVAAASDDAAPGHALYGVDRTLESIGIGSGGPAERIAEARALLDGGLVSEAIAHAAEAVDAGAAEGDESPEAAFASEELRGAAETVAGADPEAESEEVRDSVEAMLIEMADMIENGDSKGPGFGQRVAEMARGIRGDDEEAETDDPEQGEGDEVEEQGSPDDVPAGPPQSTPGPPDDNTGSPGNGPPGTGGPPGNGPPGNAPPGTGGPPGNGPPGTGPPGTGGPPGNGPPGTGGPPGSGPPGSDGPPGRP